MGTQEEFDKNPVTSQGVRASTAWNSGPGSVNNNMGVAGQVISLLFPLISQQGELVRL